MSKKVFLTGGSGFVGQNIIPDLIHAGYQVIGLTRSSTSAKKIQDLGATAIMDDLTNLSHNTAAALKDCDFVVHSAAYMDLNYEKDTFFKINVEGTKQLVDLSKSNGIKRFIYISAAPVVPGSPIKNINEDTAQKGLPKALYPKTKAIAEQYVLAANTSNFKTISLRPPAIWGPNNHHFQEVLDLVRKGKWVWIGGGHQILSTIHIKNLASAILAALRHGQGGEAYFVTDGDRRSMRSSFSAIFKAHGVEPGNREIPLNIASILANILEFVWKLFGWKSRPPIPPLLIRLMAREFSVSDEKARKELQYKNAISFEEGIQSLLR